MIAVAALAIAAYGGYVMSQQNPYTYTRGIGMMAGGAMATLLATAVFCCSCGGSRDRLDSVYDAQTAGFRGQARRGHGRQQSVDRWGVPQKGPYGQQPPPHLYRSANCSSS